MLNTLFTGVRSSNEAMVSVELDIVMLNLNTGISVQFASMLIEDVVSLLKLLSFAGLIGMIIGGLVSKV